MFPIVIVIIIRIGEKFEKYGGDERSIRDEMIAAVAPELHGLTIPKFGLLLVWCSGTKSEEKATSESTRKI